ncbi:MAG: hypothetical protein WB425_00285 [Terracidiphilus sp.]
MSRHPRQIFVYFRPMRQNLQPPDRTPLLSWLMFPIGVEVGFSSAGAGALGSAALLSTRVPRRQLRFAL